MTGAVEKAGDVGSLDVEGMRWTVNRLLDPDAVPDVLPPAAEEVRTLTAVLRGHLELLMPQVERLAKRLPESSIPRYCALACLGEARERLRASPSPAPGGDVAYARRLARAVNALCDDFEKLGKAAS
ncbi:DUF6415 family natural product biosynthesis protein [Streptomyces sp. NPDC046931]|uniref:DUF6415 family natural product biosynthesis protein n=1 Tax=Streptomyces sp. NPDC046931 TaxID=3154806 RepID=UPI0033C9633E